VCSGGRRSENLNRKGRKRKDLVTYFLFVRSSFRSFVLSFVRSFVCSSFRCFVVRRSSFVVHPFVVLSFVVRRSSFVRSFIVRRLVFGFWFLVFGFWFAVATSQ